MRGKDRWDALFSVGDDAAHCAMGGNDRGQEAEAKKGEGNHIERVFDMLI